MTKSAIAVRGESDVAFASAGSEEDLVQRATALIPTLRGRCDETEERRSLTLETRRDLMESGVHRIFQPRRFGGVEGSMRAGVDILIETGRGCASTAQGPDCGARGGTPRVAVGDRAGRPGGGGDRVPDRAPYDPTGALADGAAAPGAGRRLRTGFARAVPGPVK
jgi:hypothetical protein